MWAGLTDNHVKLPMALTAEKLGEQYGITREQCDEFALTSQERWSNGEPAREEKLSYRPLKALNKHTVFEPTNSI